MEIDKATARVVAAADRIEYAHIQLLEARRQLRRALEARSKSGGRQPGVCGTPSGYRKHQRRNEAACMACTEAYTWYRRKSR